MADNMSQKLLEDQADVDHHGAEDSDGFDELKDSLQNISKFWAKKQKAAFDFRGGVIDRDTRAPWRKALAEYLESTPVHIFIVSLLLIDLFATAVDILKTIHNKTIDLESCSGYLEQCQCVEHFERTETWEFVFWISISILSVLAVNVILLLVSNGVYFFRNPGYMLDAFVVGTALFLEIFLSTDTVGLLVILTLWRIVRVAHGIFEVTDEAWETEIKKFEKRLADAEAKNATNLNLLQEKDQRIAQLEQALQQRKG